MLSPVPPEDFRRVCLFSPSTEKGLFAGTGSAGFPEVDGGAVPRLGSIEEAVFLFCFFSSLRKKA